MDSSRFAQHALPFEWRSFGVEQNPPGYHFDVVRTPAF